MPEVGGVVTEQPITRTWLVAAVYRPLRATTILLAGYFLLPIGHGNAWNAVGLVIGALMVTGFVLWEMWRIRGNSYPALVALEILTALVVLYIVVFSATYFLFSDYQPASFSEELTRLDALYYCLTIFTTTGFGTIAAVSEGARIAVSLQMVSSLILLGFGINFLASLVTDKIKHTHIGG
ncbi:MAG TPA: ion channel [Gordonia sp. (in: high G+C Gram-positive bacteria)]|uniref:ion channel n=1 Tax=unclassified Gordonia (in: high G+C Gram-positive bacteria) TaxID=2657482 RepID=UPI0025C39260|nr:MULTISPECIES: ion channel [unclassified Gordonia (in: high G+C Gram-positive bacteria)]HNP56190.1 ion channel [Gordonia sp. (in: high G+C Gram-positive bacteria)]HRC50359.1 ion channel [Gordonia sp. (in: high G+C Gram-positive bacteria)]